MSFLGWIGCQPVEDPYVLIGQLASVYFFVYFLVFMPLLGKFEHFLSNFTKVKFCGLYKSPLLKKFLIYAGV